MECVRGILITIVRLAARTPASVSENLKWNLIVRNMAETRRAPHQYSTLNGVYTEVLRNLTAVLKGETAKTITTEPTSNEEFCEQGNLQTTPTKEPRNRKYPSGE
jgi:hypothetical protein